MGTHGNGEGRLVWIDLEMTGLDTDRDSILEIATVVTDSQLNVLADGPELAIAHPLATLEAMDDWNRNQHGKSGLWRRVLEEGVPMAEAEARTLAFLREWVPAGAAVVSLLPPQNVKVRFYVPETLVATLRLGEPVTVRCDGCGGDISAKVRFIAAQAEFTSPVIYSRENRSNLVFLVEAKPDTPNAALHPGVPVEVAVAARPR